MHGNRILQEIFLLYFERVFTLIVLLFFFILVSQSYDLLNEKCLKCPMFKQFPFLSNILLNKNGQLIWKPMVSFVRIL